MSQCCGMAAGTAMPSRVSSPSRARAASRLGDFVNDFTEDQVYQLTDVGNGPSMYYIMRNIKWQGVE